MTYQRPQNQNTLTKEQKVRLLQEYVEYYAQLVKGNPNGYESLLNRKVKREAFDTLLDQIGSVFLDESAKLACTPGPVRDFLTENPLPESMAELLPDRFRVYCLALNSLKQWVAAEQAATDRYLLGGVARSLCFEAR